MESDGLTKNRRVIPRWRAFNRTKPRELSSAKNLEPKSQNSSNVLKDYYEEWRRNPTIENATEVIDVAVLEKNKTLAYGPADQILKSQDTLPTVKKVANFVISGSSKENEDNFENTKFNNQILKNDIITNIRFLKSRTIDEPRNSLLWLELSRLNASIGNIENAELSMKRAYATAPENRYVLRAMVRFFTHIDKPWEAHGRIKNAESINHDPWVQSAEISIASLIGAIPRSIKSGKNIIERNHLSPIHTSELASAIATEELISGKNKVAKNLYKHSLINPTENAMAQAIWAKNKANLGISFEAEDLLLERAFEARTKIAISDSSYEDALNHCALWSQDEPFSIIPVMEGSFIALAFLEDYQAALNFVNQGLFSNPQFSSLWNNGAVALAKSGNIRKAKEYFSKVEHNLAKRDPTALATKGLIEFRSGEWQSGRDFYEKSALEAVKNKEPSTLFRAKYHWIYEEVVAGTISSDMSKKMIGLLDEEAKKYKSHISKSTVAHWEFTKKQISKLAKENVNRSISLFNPEIMTKQIANKEI